MYTIRRTSTAPASPLVVQVDGQAADANDGQFQQGGVYAFMPAGQDDDHHQVPEHVARKIMASGLDQHLTCDPDLPAAVPAATEQPDGAKGATKAPAKPAK